MDKQYQKQCPIDGGTCGQGGTCFVCENEALGSQLTAANARIAELKRVNAIMDEELRTKTQALFDLEQDNEHLLEVNGRLQKKAGDIEQCLRDCLNALRMASRGRCPAARRAAALLEKK